MAPLRYAAKFDPFLSLGCAPTPSTLAQSGNHDESEKSERAIQTKLVKSCFGSHGLAESRWKMFLIQLGEWIPAVGGSIEA